MCMGYTKGCCIGTYLPCRPAFVPCSGPRCGCRAISVGRYRWAYRGVDDIWYALSMEYTAFIWRSMVHNIDPDCWISILNTQSRSWLFNVYIEYSISILNNQYLPWILKIDPDCSISILNTQCLSWVFNMDAACWMSILSIQYGCCCTRGTC